MGLYFRMEQKFGHLGISGLVRILAFFKLITWILLSFRTGEDQLAFLSLLYFDLEAIYAGEVWRLLSFLILPGSVNSIFILFEVIFLFMIGDSLERSWGAFGVTLYYFSSVLLGILVCVILSVKFRYPGLSNGAIYASLIMAAAALYPDTIIQLFLVIPIKLKWIGMLAAFGVFMGVFRVMGGGLGSFLGFGVPMLACLIPFAVVFVPAFVKGAQHRSKVAARRSRFEKAKLPETEAFHRCDRCGVTEVSHADREFRITAGGEELCSECRDAGSGVDGGEGNGKAPGSNAEPDADTEPDTKTA